MPPRIPFRERAKSAARGAGSVALARCGAAKHSPPPAAHEAGRHRFDGDLEAASSCNGARFGLKPKRAWPSSRSWKAGTHPQIALCSGVPEPQRIRTPRGDRGARDGHRGSSRINHPRAVPDRPAGDPQPPSGATPNIGLRERLPSTGYRSPQCVATALTCPPNRGKSIADSASACEATVSSPPATCTATSPGSLERAA